MAYPIEIRSLSHGFAGKKGENRRMLYEDAGLVVPEGDVFVLLGKNGIGKSTLLKTIAGIEKIQQGDILIGGDSIRDLPSKEMAELISYVSTDIVRISNLSVHDMVAIGRSPHTNWIGKLTGEDMGIVNRSLDMVGMASFAGRDFGTLSDGERQRVMIARALAQDSHIILLDEPTAFLDVPNKYETALLLRRLARELGKTVVFSTHDLNLALRLADTVCVMDGGKFYTGAPEDMLLDGEISRIFSGTKLDYDIRSGDVKFTEPQTGLIFLDSPQEYYVLLEHALERYGIGLSEDPFHPKKLKASGGATGSIELKLTDGNNEHEFRSVGDLLSFIRKSGLS